MLRLPPFHYIAPRSLDEAARLLADYGERAMPVAGGTDLYPNMKRRQFTPEALVGLRGLRELRGIAGDPAQGMIIGALVGWLIGKNKGLGGLGAVLGGLLGLIGWIIVGVMKGNRDDPKP